MPSKDLGNKHSCFKCGTKFYDLKKAVPLCPKCGADQRESPALKPPPAEKRSRAAPRVVEPEVEPVLEEVEGEEGAEELDEELEDDES